MMTNEQVIINNIDVSECEHLTETRHCRAQMAVMGTDANRCKCFPNCHYKQLVREKQECEKLKKQHNCYACDTCNGKEDYIQLKKHCENAIKSLHNKQAELNRLKADNKQLKEELSRVYEDIKLSPLCYKCDEDVAITLGERDKDFPEGSFAAWYGEDLSRQTYEGDLDCSNKKLTSLFGCPSTVTGDFDCSYNQLISLKGAPKKVGRSLDCSYNQLTSLEGSPKEVGGKFDCLNNPNLKSLEGLGEVKRDIYSDIDYNISNVQNDLR